MEGRDFPSESDLSARPGVRTWRACPSSPPRARDAPRRQGFPRQGRRRRVLRRRVHARVRGGGARHLRNRARARSFENLWQRHRHFTAPARRVGGAPRRGVCDHRRHLQRVLRILR